MWECIFCNAINQYDNAKFCPKCGSEKTDITENFDEIIPESPIDATVNSVIFDEEAIAKIAARKLEVDEENEKERQRKKALLEFTYNCLKEFPIIASRIGLKKIGPKYDGDKNKHGWGMFYVQTSSGLGLYDYPRDDQKMDDKQIMDYAKTINLYFDDINDVREMITTALTGRYKVAKS